MAITNQQRVADGLELLRKGLQPFLERELSDAYGAKWRDKVRHILADTRLKVNDQGIDVAALLVLLDREWKDLFSTQTRQSASLARERTDRGPE